MLKSSWILTAILLSSTAFGEVSFQEKKNRVEYLEELIQDPVSMNIEAFHRELEYEKQNLTLDQRAQNEANLLAEKVKVQVQKAYESSLEEHDEAEAEEMVKEQIEKDLLLVAPELQDEIKNIALSALEDAKSGGMSRNTNLSNLENVLLKNVKDRVEFLNEEGEEVDLVAYMDNRPTSNASRDAERKEYSSKAQILESLTSDRENTRWVSTSNMQLKSENSTKFDSRISLQIKVEFMGVAVDAGPTIQFSRKYSTNVSVMAEGLNPVLGSDGNFDFNKRDKYGRVVVEGGKVQKRFVAFTCNADLEFSSEYEGSGGFSVAGAGARTTLARSYSNSVNLSSRRIFVPEYIARQTVTFKYLTQLCHMDFLKARVTNSMNIAGSLNMMMRNVIAGLRFSHPKTKCATDRHCYSWFNRTAFTVSKAKAWPRCVEETREKYRACEIRGLKGMNCAIYEGGKRTSDGMFEVKCDKGLRCVKYQSAGWFQGFDLYRYAKGSCQPINPRTYKSPRG